MRAADVSASLFMTMRSGMHSGPVAMFDALGFKGIWQRHKPEDVLAKLHRLAEVGAQIPQQFGGANPPVESMLESVHVTLLSDTVVMGLGVKQVQDLPAHVQTSGRVSQQLFDGTALVFLAQCVGSFMLEAARDEPVLSYRGAISFGQHVITDRFVVGPAIDDAAEHMNLASAALVLFTPRALDSCAYDSSCAFRYAAPLSAGGTFETRVANPFWSIPATDDITECTSRMLRSFYTPSVRVRVLRDNTAAYLRAAAAARDARSADR